MNELLDRYKEETLKWCNEMRTKNGKEPLPELPKGKKTDPLSCPCGSATGLHVGKYSFHDPLTLLLLGELPALVQAFVNAFDNGEYPELVLPGGD